MDIEQIVLIVSLVVSPLYVGFWKIYDKMIKIGCDVTALKTANNIYHEDSDKIE